MGKTAAGENAHESFSGGVCAGVRLVVVPKFLQGSCLDRGDVVGDLTRDGRCS
jgi:hypothetical protein